MLLAVLDTWPLLTSILSQSPYNKNVFTGDLTWMKTFYLRNVMHGNKGDNSILLWKRHSGSFTIALPLTRVGSKRGQGRSSGGRDIRTWLVSVMSRTPETLDSKMQLSATFFTADFIGLVIAGKSQVLLTALMMPHVTRSHRAQHQLRHWSR